MNGSEPGRMFELTTGAPVSTQGPPGMAQQAPPSGNRVYTPVVTGGYGVVASDGMSSSGGTGGSGSIAFQQSININERSGSGGEMAVKKRGRPRKYAPDGTISASAVRPVKVTPVNVVPGVGAGGMVNGGFEQQRQQVPQPMAAAPPISVAPVSSIPMEEGFASMKKKGRPPGSVNKKPRMRESFGLPVGSPGSAVGSPGSAVGSAGFGFTPHIIVVQPGEDVLNKIMSFSQNGPRAVCIMSGIGVITNVTLRQAATSGGTATYEGRFDILALSGSFVLSEVFGHRTRTGGLSVTLSGPDGRVFGGVVAGLLIAASPVQVIVGSFLPENSKDHMAANHVEPLNATPKFTPANHAAGPSSSQSHGTLSESSGGPGSPMNQGNNSSPQGMANMPWK